MAAVAPHLCLKPRSATAVIAAALLTVIVACGGTSPTVIPSPVPSATASPPPGAHPPSTRTGVPAVDRFLDLWFFNDSATIAAEAMFKDSPCSRIFGSVPCEDVMPEGTIRSAILVASCSPHYLFSHDDLQQWLGPEPGFYFRYLFAVYEEPEPTERSYYLVALGADVGPEVDPSDALDLSRAFYLDREGHLTATIGCGSGWPPPAGARIILAPGDQ